MRKNITKAVWMVVTIFCAAFVASCDSYDFTEQEREDNLIEKSCLVNENIFNHSGVVAMTRAAIDYEKPDGYLKVTSNHTKNFIWNFNPVERKYQGFFWVKAYNVNRPRFAKNADIFKNPTWSEKVIGKDSILQVITFPDGATHDFDVSLLETQYYDTDTVMVGGKVFNKCKNAWATRQLLGSEVTDLQRDSADWHAWKVVLKFHYELEEGPNTAVDWTVTMPTVWIAKPGTDPDIPEGDHEIISNKDGEKGIEILNDSIADSWQILIPVLSNGEDGTPFTKHAYLKYKLRAPEYRIVPVADLTWKSLTAKGSDPVKVGELQDRGDSVFVQGYTQAFTCYTSKCDAVFFGDFEGAAYYVDQFGKAHSFLDAKWSFKDDGWKDSKLDDLDGLKRLLLTSNITGTYLTKKPTAKGEVELRTGGEGGKRVIKFTYKNFGIRSVVPMSEYWSYATQVAHYNDNDSTEIGEVGLKIFMNVDSPAEQTIQVFDWTINDGKPQLYDPKAEGDPRSEKVATGTFKVQKYSRDYVTTTNKSEHKFISHAETSVIFTDSLGKETPFKGIELTYADNGSVKSLEALSDQDDKERKKMTPSVKITAIGTDNADYSGIVNFWKAKDKEELINDPNQDYTQNLTYNGNGSWTSTTTITYVWKIKGTETETITQNLEWSLSGEAKSQVILNEAKADYVAPINQGNWGAETSSTPQNFVTLYTSTNTSISENYTNLTDKYSAKKQRAVINKTVDGKKIEITMLAPTEMTVAHGSGSLENGNRTTTKNGKTYDVWDHTGSVTATVTSSVGNQTESATDLKEVLIEAAPIEPHHPEWGFPVAFVRATLTYRPYVGESGQGAFHKTLVMKFENGILVVTTASYGRDKAWNPIDFTYDEEDFYFFEGKQPTGVTRTIPESANINSAALFDGRWKPALVWPDGTGWKYIVDATHYVNMSKQLAETCGIKNFSGKATADVTPYLNYTGSVSADKILVVKNENGAPIFSIK